MPASPDTSLTLTPAEVPWWRGAVFYQIYPRSFRDSNADGIGDLIGIVQGLDHIAALGVDAVWISPFFTSPMMDFGYDVADFCGIDPSYGTFEDLDQLVAKAHGLGLKVIIDQVYSHTSDQHPWFMESRESRDNPKADWYVWADALPDGSPPNNWQSVFGGAAWQWDGRRKQYYLHNFLTSQPDLNLHYQPVQEALLDVARFWMARGIDGFRLDAINFAMHDPRLQDNPPSSLPMDQVTRPFDMQAHDYNQSHDAIPLFLEKVRGVLDDYPDRFTVAEVVGADPLAEMKAFTQGDTRLSSAYNFDFLYAPDLTAARVKKTLAQWGSDQGEGWPSWAFSNHDAPRAVSRWAAGEPLDATARLLMLLLTAFRGNPFFYQGEELGMPQGQVAFEDLKDPEAIANWPHTLGRDGARTPMPWQRDAAFAGFSQGGAWIKPDPAHATYAVDVQTADPASVLHFCRALLACRKHHAPLVFGDLTLLPSPDEVVAFTRQHGGEEVLCAFNLSHAPVAWHPGAAWEKANMIATSDGGPEALVEAPSDLPDPMPPWWGYWAVRS